MSILGSGISEVRNLNSKVRSRLIDKLTKDTEKAEKTFTSEAKRLGIELGHFNFKNYYEVLGIKYTNDPKAIKSSYLKLIKQYHPDVSEDSMATAKTEEINEAYSVLKDSERKKDYDLKFSKGKNRMSFDADKILYNEFVQAYQEARDKDFDDFNKRIANPQNMDSIKATIEETTNWTKRFRQVSANYFGRFRDYGQVLKRMRLENKALLVGEKDPQNLGRIKYNISSLDGLIEAFGEADKGISSVLSRAMDDISLQENNIADRIRRSIN